MFGPVRITSWLAPPLKRDVVRHERLGGGRPPLHHRVARFDDDHFVAVVDVRFDVVVDGGGLGQRAERVERGQRARRRLDARRFGRDRAAQQLEDLQFALEDPLVAPSTFSSYSLSAGVM